MAKCLEYAICQSITAVANWKKCYIGGWGDESSRILLAEKHRANWFCYERIVTDVYSFIEHADTMCMRGGVLKNGDRLQTKVVIDARGHRKPSEVRACQVMCANDDECDGFNTVFHRCFMQTGRGYKLNMKADPKGKHTCYEKTLSTVSKAQLCWQANNLGICDKAYGTDNQGSPQSECESDFAVNGFGVDGAETGSKFCKYLARTMQINGKNWSKEVHPVSTLTSLANLCGELCPSKTTWTYVAKMCRSNNIFKDGKVVKDRFNNISDCLAKCAANVACKAVTRTHNLCLYQSKVEPADLKVGNGSWHCYAKN